uniref:HAD family hydrolase n=1 Tax=uncultured Streptococcus sp. TaxID=83427 RepID=UPI0028D3AD59
MIKILALDMDGTLLNSKKEIPQANIEALHRAIEKGVKLFLCTGRPLVGVKPYYTN